jgi:hypothetical protein
MANTNPLGSIFKTPGVDNVEKAFIRGGGTATHTPGSDTNTSSAEQVAPRQEKVQGIGSEQYQDKISDQRQEVRVVKDGKSVANTSSQMSWEKPLIQ